MAVYEDPIRSRRRDTWSLIIYDSLYTVRPVKLSVKTEKNTIAKVMRGTFQEFIPIIYVKKKRKMMRIVRLLDCWIQP